MRIWDLTPFAPCLGAIRLAGTNTVVSGTFFSDFPLSSATTVVSDADPLASQRKTWRKTARTAHVTRIAARRFSVIRHTKGLNYAVFDTTGRYVFTGLVDHAESGINVRGTAKAPPRLIRREGVSSCGVSAWDMAKREQIWSADLKGPFSAFESGTSTPSPFVVSPDGRYVAALPEPSRPFGDPRRDLRVWDVGTGRKIELDLNRGLDYRSVGFLPDSTCYVVTVAKGNSSEVPWQAQLWDALGNRPLSSPLPLSGRPMRVAVSPDGSHLITISEKDASDPNWQAQVWSLDTGELVSQWSSQPRESRSSADRLRHVSFTGDSRKVLIVRGTEPLGDGGRSYGETTLWDVGEARMIARLEHRGAVTHAESSATGDLVVTASTDRTARVWDTATGKPVTPPLAHADIVNYAAFSPDGRVVVTASADRTARVWDALTGAPITPPLEHDNRVMHASFASDGAQVITASLDRTARLWDLSADSHPLPDLLSLAALLSGHQVDSTGGCTPLSTESLTEAWEHLKKKYKAEFDTSKEDAHVWHQQHADESEVARNWFAAIVHLDYLIEADPEDSHLLRRRANAHASLGQWENADADYSAAIRQGEDDASAWREYAVVLLQLGKTAEHRETCEQMLEHFAKTDDLATANTVVRTCLLVPDALPDFGPLLRLLEDAAGDKGPAGAMYAAMAGAAHYRSGNLNAAIKELGGSTRIAPRTSAMWPWLFLAMTYHQMGNAEEANNLLQRARQWLDHDLKERERIFGTSRIRWDERTEVQLLRREAESLIVRDPATSRHNKAEGDTNGVE